MTEKTYDNTNRGALFRNENKSQPDRPDYMDNRDVNGIPHRLVGWVAVSRKDGKKFLSIVITEIKPDQKVETKTEATMPDFWEWQ